MPNTTASTAPQTKSPIDQLVHAIGTAGSPACIGIDPVYSKLPKALGSLPELEAIETFSLAILDAIKESAAVVKPQSACFERYGSKGYAILEKIIAHARDLGLIVILDAKRGDIGSSATHYAVGAADMGAHFITVSPYMGPSSIEPFLDAGLGVFALARTSNPDSDRVQLQELRDGSRVTHAISSMIAEMGQSALGERGLSNLGAVVGATKSAQDVQKLRKLMPNAMFLVPGVGAQGGTVEDVRPMTRIDTSDGLQTVGELGVIVNASRSVIYPEANASESWQSAIQRAAGDFSASLRQLAN